MLILSAKPKQERIVVDDRVEISVLKVVGNRVYLAIHGVEGSTIDRLSVAKLKRDYESPFDELFERLKEEPEPKTRRTQDGDGENGGKSAASTLREYKERRRLNVERELGEISEKLERVAENVAFEPSDESTDATPEQDFHNFVD